MRYCVGRDACNGYCVADTEDDNRNITASTGKWTKRRAQERANQLNAEDAKPKAEPTGLSKEREERITAVLKRYGLL